MSTKNPGLDIIGYVVKSFVTLFLVVVATILVSLWLVIGTIIMVTLLIRIIILYTIALLNSSVSGNPLNHDYINTINEIVTMYIDKYSRFMSLPKEPWKEISAEPTNDGFRALTSQEFDLLKKSWLITGFVFISIVISFSGTLVYMIMKTNWAENKEVQRTTIYYEQILEEYKDSTNTVNQQLYNDKIRISDNYKKSLMFLAKWVYPDHSKISTQLDIPKSEIDSILLIPN